MDATFHIKKLDFSFNHRKLYRAKTRVFEFSGKIKQVWALRNFPFPEISTTAFTFPAYLKYTVITGVSRVNNRCFYSKKFNVVNN
jgi:hypothetical protein